MVPTSGHACGSPAGADQSPRRARNTSAVATATPGLTSTRPHVGILGAGSSRSPTPPMRLGRPARQTGTSAPNVSAIPGKSGGASFHSLHSSRRAAAASAEPPPMPDATGRFFSSLARAVATQGAGCTQHQIVLLVRQGRPERARDAQRQLLGGLRMQYIANARKHHEAVEQMIAVIPAASNVQEKVDLRRGRLGQRHGQSRITAR